MSSPHLGSPPAKFTGSWASKEHATASPRLMNAVTQMGRGSYAASVPSRHPWEWVPLWPAVLGSLTLELAFSCRTLAGGRRCSRFIHGRCAVLQTGERFAAVVGAELARSPAQVCSVGEVPRDPHHRIRTPLLHDDMH